MRNKHEIVGNIAIIGGLLTSAGSAVDAFVNKALFQELSTRSAITESIRDKYGIEEQCGSGLFGSPSCFDVVSGKSGEEKEELLDEYRQELNREQAKIPSNPRGYMDLGAFTGGLVVASFGDVIKRRSRE